MRRKHIPSVFGIVLVALVVAAAPVAAHSWETTVTQGPMELGISSSPGTPVAGMQTEFSGRIADSEVAEGDEDRLSWGGVTNKTIEVHINGPDGIHDHVKAEIPEDDAHFHISYQFPDAGNYSITVVAELEGEEYAFEFQEEVILMPARATGPEMDAVSSDVAELQTQVDSLQQQLDEHEKQLDEDQSTNEESNNVAGAQGAGFGVTVVLVALVGIVSFVAGRRQS